MPNTHKIKKTITCLAFDFGTKSIGVAVGNSVSESAEELNTIKATEGIPNWDILKDLISEWQATHVIVGLPLNMDGSEGEITRRAKKFGNRLHGRFGVELDFVDERLTTREAKSEASQSGHKGDYAKNPVDSIAARLILESWWRSSSNPPPKTKND